MRPNCVLCCSLDDDVGWEEHAEDFCDMPPLEWSTDEEGTATEHYSGESDPGEFFGVNPFEHGGYNDGDSSILFTPIQVLTLL